MLPRSLAGPWLESAVRCLLDSTHGQLQCFVLFSGAFMSCVQVTGFFLSFFDAVAPAGWQQARRRRRCGCRRSTGIAESLMPVILTTFDEYILAKTEAVWKVPGRKVPR